MVPHAARGDSAAYQADPRGHAGVYGDVPADDMSTDAWADVTTHVTLPQRLRSGPTEGPAGTSPADQKGSSK
jgi:hypothetical protein